MIVGITKCATFVANVFLLQVVVPYVESVTNGVLRK